MSFTIVWKILRFRGFVALASQIKASLIACKSLNNIIIIIFLNKKIGRVYAKFNDLINRKGKNSQKKLKKS